MDKLVVLKIGTGSLEQGFSVLLQIGEENARPAIELTGHLPPAPELRQHYDHWQASYRRLGMQSRLAPAAQPVKKVTATAACLDAAATLHQQFQRWLQSESFRPLREKWLERLSPDESIRVLLQTEDILLQRLPWHQWDLLERYPQAEIALSAPNYEQPVVAARAATGKVRILAILGDRRGINTQTDQQLLEQLPQAEVHVLVEPERAELSNHLWTQPWDILFFAGHSQTTDIGTIALNPHDHLSLAELRYALRRAIAQGLQLAIFNSCDGLGLAQDLADLQIPQLIVMREPVPDYVAQAFLQFFLAGYAHHQPLYQAVRSARERLQALENRFPCATWLPVLYQHPALSPPTWQALVESPPSPLPAQPMRSVTTWRRTVTAGLAIALGVNVLRLAGLFQAVELRAFDHLLRHRPTENPDPRLVLVQIGDDDIEYQRQQQDLKGVSLADAPLSRLLQILEPHQPRVIGLALYRDYATHPKETALIRRLQQGQNLVSLCKVSDSQDDPHGVRPPAEVPDDRLGFSDFLTDADQHLRRHLLFMNPEATSHCQATYAFSSQIALRYLLQEGIEPSFSATGNLQLGSLELLRLQPRSGAYQGIDAQGGQILLNYRATATIAETVALRDLLTGKVPPTALERIFRDRIVLIGVTAKTASDRWHTPITSSTETLPGIIVQAHMVSQLLSHVLDQRPLLRPLSLPLEALWITAWALLGAILTPIAFCPQRRSPYWRALLIGSGLTLLLYGCCWLALLGGLWLPLVPPAIALSTTSLIAGAPLSQKHPPRGRAISAS